jgi:hypothetical protein
LVKFCEGDRLYGFLTAALYSAGAKLAQLVPLMFAGMTFTIFDAVANINNRINSNNNNNNNQNINFQESVNTGKLLHGVHFNNTVADRIPWSRKFVSNMNQKSSPSLNNPQPIKRKNASVKFKVSTKGGQTAILVRWSADYRNVSGPADWKK